MSGRQSDPHHAPRAVSTDPPQDLVANPRLSTWISVDRDGTVSLRVGKVELGQGILTALAQIAADELDVAPEAVRMLPATTAGGPDEGTTSGSMSIVDAGAAVRQVCAQVRGLFQAEAARRLGVEKASIQIRNGHITTSSGSGVTSYGELAATVTLDRDAQASVPTKAPADLRLIGTSVPRIDLHDKVTGIPRFLSDLELPGQLWGRVLRPPSPGATLEAVDLDVVRRLSGVVEVARDGSFLGVVCESERQADLALEALRAAASWREQSTLPDENDLSTYLRTPPHARIDVDDRAAGSQVSEPVREVSATYSRPLLAHASMSPSCGAARWSDGKVHVWTHSQGIFTFRAAIAAALEIELDDVVVEHVEGAGAYGHNGADDAAFDAVLLARTVPGRPVHVRWSRRDELTWSPFGSPMVIDITAGVDGAGCLVSWQSDIWSHGHTARPGYSGSPGLLALQHREPAQVLPPPGDPPPERGGGTTRNAIPGYEIPTRCIRGHRKQDVSLRTSSLRSLGAFGNVFAIESMIDEVALLTGADPLTFRLNHLRDERGQAVLVAAAERGGWMTRADRRREEGIGYGLGYARYKERAAYCAVVAEVEAVHDIRLRRLTLAVDVGRVVNPDGVRNQIEGGAVQSASWTLKERVRFDRTRFTSDDWESYPILRFSEAPVVEVEVLDRPDLPSMGAGEAAQGPTAAAIANAVADAIGVRVRDLPITAQQVVRAMEHLENA